MPPLVEVSLPRAGSVAARWSTHVSVLRLALCSGVLAWCVGLCEASVVCVPECAKGYICGEFF
jgi:hypothetical protein